MVSSSIQAEGRLPLDDITVIDFSANAAGPSCAMLLGDFGATVIKIEPESGDATRHWGTARFGEDGQFTGTFLALNRNKSSLVLDLKSEEGKRVVRKLIESADVVIQSYVPSVATRLGLDYETLAEINDRVIHCSISGFGLCGPMRDRPGFDMLLQAFAGHMSITGEADAPSVRVGPSSIDFITGAHAAFGIMVALKERERSGKGQAIDISLLDSAVHLVGNHISDCSGTGKAPEKFGSQFSMMAPYGIFQASDREFCMLVSSDDMWQRLCAALSRQDLAEDDRYRTNSKRLLSRAPLYSALLPLFLEKPAAAWVELAQDLAIPASLIHTMPEVLDHEQVNARGLIVDTGIDGVKIIGVPLKLSRTPGQIRRQAPRLGEDTERILKKLDDGGATVSVDSPDNS